jgi:hypothetical protein
MAQQSITNKLIANIKQTTNVETNFNNTRNVVCIDTCNNRIGINTRSPQYSIDISGDDSSLNALNSQYIHVSKTAYINEVSGISIKSQDLSINNIADISLLLFNTVSGDFIYSSEKIDASLLVVQTISTELFKVPEIQCTSGIFQDISVNNKINAVNIFCESLKANTVNQEDMCLNEITIINNADLSFVESNEISNNTIIKTNQLIVFNDATFQNNASFENITVSSDASLNRLDVSGTADISFLNAQTISADTINVSIIKNANGDTLFNTNGNNIGGNDAIFIGNSVTCNTLTVNSNANINGNLETDNLKINNRLEFDPLGRFILPLYDSTTSNFDETSIIENSLLYDLPNRTLKIKNSQGAGFQNLFFDVIYNTYGLNKDVSGNNVEYNAIQERFYIDNSNDLLFKEFVTTNDNNDTYKFVPLDTGNNGTTKFSTINPKFVEISSIKETDIVEINANICLQFLNKIPGDVEVNTYTFGLYKLPLTIPSNFSLSDNRLVEIKNSIMVFDNSHNFANSSINYIGSVDTSNPRLAFLISSNNEINYIAIDSFNATFKQLQ